MRWLVALLFMVIFSTGVSANLLDEHIVGTPDAGTIANTYDTNGYSYDLRGSEHVFITQEMNIQPIMYMTIWLLDNNKDLDLELWNYDTNTYDYIGTIASSNSKVSAQFEVNTTNRYNTTTNTMQIRMLASNSVWILDKFLISSAGLVETIKRVESVDWVGNVGNVAVCQSVNETKMSVYGTEYQVGDDMRMYLQLLDGQSQGVTNATCYADIYYPDKTGWQIDALMSQLTLDKSLYYYDVVAPNQTGLYMLTAQCFFITDDVTEYADSYTAVAGEYLSGPLYYTEESDDQYIIFNNSAGSIEIDFVFDDINISVVNDNLNVLFEGMCLNLGGFEYPNPEDNQTVINLTDIVLFHHFNNDSALGENSTLYVDSSGEGNDGVCSGITCPEIAEGFFGNGALHDGSTNYIDFGNASSLNSFEEITLAAWVRPEGPYTQWMLPISKGVSGWGDWALALNIDDGWALFRVNNASGSGTWVGHYGTPLYDIGDWVFIAGTYNQSHATLYVATSEDTTLFNKTFTFISGPVNNDVAGTVKTGDPDGGTNEFEGTIDELMVFNRSLSFEEINTLFDYTNDFVEEDLYFQAYNYNTSSWVNLTNSQSCQEMGYDQTTGNQLVNGVQYVNASNSLMVKLTVFDSIANYNLRTDVLFVDVPLYSGEFIDSIRGGGEFHVTDRQFELLQTIPEDVWTHNPRTVEINFTDVAIEVWNTNTTNTTSGNTLIYNIWNYIARYIHGEII